MIVQKSAQDYLETIYVLNKNTKKTRSIDIAKSMGFSKPSVSVALKHLKDQGLVLVDIEGYITLTEKGKDIAIVIFERHQVISNFFIELGVDAQTAREDACKIEHEISVQSFECLKAHIKNLKDSN